MLINTLFAKNIPGEITLPIDEVVKSGNRSNTAEGEETLAVIASLYISRRVDSG